MPANTDGDCTLIGRATHYRPHTTAGARTGGGPGPSSANGQALSVTERKAVLAPINTTPANADLSIGQIWAP